jgi:hypothetical protein
LIFFVFHHLDWRARCSQLAYSMRRLIISALVAACCVPLPGATLLHLGLDDMIGKSTAIVHATVQSSYSAFRGPLIYTHYAVQVTTTYKGVPVLYWDLAVPGGVVNGVQQTVAGAPTLTPGQDYFLFLWTSKTGLTQLIGLSQGLFNVTSNASGQLMVTRGATSATMLNTSGQIMTDSNIQMTLAQMSSRIQAVLAGGSGQ